jgi:thiol-disulfide isomerase/thioredoxin
MKTKPILLTLVIAAVLGSGLYAILGGSGNTSVGTATASNELTREQSCALSVERGKSIDAAATGDLAAYRAVEDPLDLTTLMSFKDVDGNEKTLADWSGRMVLLNLWATWCPPCREEMPWLEELEVTKGGENFQVVPVSIDAGDKGKPLDFLKSIDIKAMPFMHDNTMNAFHNLRKKGVALGMPTTLLVDTNGCALGVLNGPAHWASDDAKRFIDAALGLGKV